MGCITKRSGSSKCPVGRRDENLTQEAAKKVFLRDNLSVHIGLQLVAAGVVRKALQGRVFRAELQQAIQFVGMRRVMEAAIDMDRSCRETFLLESIYDGGMVVRRRSDGDSGLV